MIARSVIAAEGQEKFDGKIGRQSGRQSGGVPGANDLWELKDGKKVASARKLTTHEFEWHQRWRGPVCIVRSIEEAEERLKWIRERALKNE